MNIPISDDEKEEDDARRISSWKGYFVRAM